MRREAHPSIPIAPRRSAVAPSLHRPSSGPEPRLISRPSSSLSRNPTGFDQQDEAAGLAADDAFEYLRNLPLLTEAVESVALRRGIRV